MKIGITLTSSLAVGSEYIALTQEVARQLALSGDGIVYGGTNYGMMSALARSYKEAGGTPLVGVMAKDLMAVTKGYVAYEELDKTYLEKTMEARKQQIIEQSDGFLILPGGYGTFEEIGAIIGGRANKLFDKPIVILNYNHFYDTLLNFLEEMQRKQFSKISVRDIVFVTDSIEGGLEHFKNYQQKELVDKFVA